MAILKFTITTTLSSSPEKLFEALTKPTLIKKWSGQKGKVEPKAGGNISLFDGWVKGTVLAFNKGKLLSFTWLPSDWPQGADSSVVEIQFRRSALGTQLFLTHLHFPNREEMDNHKQGWHDFVFEPLKQYSRQQSS